jgi:hypothetical protein
MLSILIQWLETEIVRLSHLRDRASEKGRRKEYPLLFNTFFITIVHAVGLLFISMVQSIMCRKMRPECYIYCSFLVLSISSSSKSFRLSFSFSVHKLW